MKRKLEDFAPSRDRVITELRLDMLNMNRNCIKQFITYWKQKVMTNMSEDGNFMEKKMNGAALYQCFNHFWTIEGRKAESKPTLTKFGTEIKQFRDDVVFKDTGKCMTYEIILV